MVYFILKTKSLACVQAPCFRPGATATATHRGPPHNPAQQQTRDTWQGQSHITQHALHVMRRWRCVWPRTPRTELRLGKDPRSAVVEDSIWTQSSPPLTIQHLATTGRETGHVATTATSLSIWTKSVCTSVLVRAHLEGIAYRCVSIIRTRRWPKKVADVSTIRVIEASFQLTSKGRYPKIGQIIVDPTYRRTGYQNTAVPECIPLVWGATCSKALVPWSCLLPMAWIGDVNLTCPLEDMAYQNTSCLSIRWFCFVDA